jgi:hypothetical protein
MMRSKRGISGDGPAITTEADGTTRTGQVQAHGTRLPTGTGEYVAIPPQPGSSVISRVRDRPSQSELKKIGMLLKYRHFRCRESRLRLEPPERVLARRFPVAGLLSPVYPAFRPMLPNLDASTVTELFLFDINALSPGFGSRTRDICATSARKQPQLAQNQAVFCCVIGGLLSLMELRRRGASQGRPVRWFA